MDTLLRSSLVLRSASIDCCPCAMRLKSSSGPLGITNAVQGFQNEYREAGGTQNNSRRLGPMTHPLPSRTKGVELWSLWDAQGGEGELTGCREAVEILTRNPKKVSYDVTRDDVKVAVLIFTKSA
ncbi:hypothetical protein BDR03DRAFT_464493 [Suillus americanus]|nr:hypothetical protein BDR03DRAFT_464493 [Suillus americanus]